jgi:hypothetical protein
VRFLYYGAAAATLAISIFLYLNTPTRKAFVTEKSVWQKKAEKMLLTKNNRYLNQIPAIKNGILKNIESPETYGMYVTPESAEVCYNAGKENNLLDY